MSTPSERALILARREGYIEAKMEREKSTQLNGGSREFWAPIAERRYPLPPRVVPNVHVDAFGNNWRFVGGMLEVQGGLGSAWRIHGSAIVEANRVAVAAALTNPTISVPDDGEGDSQP